MTWVKVYFPIFLFIKSGTLDKGLSGRWTSSLEWKLAKFILKILGPSSTSLLFCSIKSFTPEKGWSGLIISREEDGQVHRSWSWLSLSWKDLAQALLPYSFVSSQVVHQQKECVSERSHSLRFLQSNAWISLQNLYLCGKWTPVYKLHTRRNTSSVWIELVLLNSNQSL